MRLSMLAVVAVAVIAGLGVVFTVRTLGLLNPPAPVAAAPEPPPAPPPAPPPPPPPTVLVPVRPLFVGDTISPIDIRVRPIRPEETKEYEDHKADYLPAVPEVTFFRFPAKDIEPDRPLRKADLQDMKKPDALNTRLLPGARAVTVGIPKQYSASGLIQVGDWVDVHLITEVSRTDNPNKSPLTGVLVQHAQVVAKRDSLYSIYAPLPPGEPVQFTLATNPYRAALLEYGRTIGVLTLVPVSASEKKRLDALREDLMQDQGKNPLGITFAQPGSPEFTQEADRIDKYTRGGLAIGNEDLARVLNLKPIDPPLPPPTAAPPPPVVPPTPPVTIEVFTGVNKTGVASFPVPSEPTPPVAPAPMQYVPPPPAQYQFQPPATNNGGTVTKPNN